MKMGRFDAMRDVEGIRRVIRSRRTPSWVKPSLRISMRRLKIVSAKLAEFDELEREFSDKIERERDSVKNAFDEMHKEMIERFGREIERQFAEQIDRARDVHNSKIDELQEEVMERIEDARGQVRRQLSA